MPERSIAFALTFIEQVKLTFVPRPQVYDEFFALMLAFKDGSIDRHTVIQRVQHLLQDHDFLLRGFSVFVTADERQGLLSQ